MTAGPRRHWRIFAYVAGSLRRRWRKNLAVATVYAFMIFSLASVVFLTEALTREARDTLRTAPEIMVQRLNAGRHGFAPVADAAPLSRIVGVRSVHARLWAYHADPDTGALLLVRVPEDGGLEGLEAAAGSGSASPPRCADRGRAPSPESRGQIARAPRSQDLGNGVAPRIRRARRGFRSGLPRTHRYACRPGDGPGASCRQPAGDPDHRGKDRGSPAGHAHDPAGRAGPDLRFRVPSPLRDGRGRAPCPGHGLHPLRLGQGHGTRPGRAEGNRDPEGNRVGDLGRPPAQVLRSARGVRRGVRGGVRPGRIRRGALPPAGHAAAAFGMVRTLPAFPSVRPAQAPTRPQCFSSSWCFPTSSPR